jgi:hypothetical protein
MGISNGSGITIDNAATLPINLATQVTGVLPITNGGWEADNFDAGMANLFGAFGYAPIDDPAVCTFLVNDTGGFHLLTANAFADSVLQNVSGLTASITRTASWTLVQNFGYAEFDCTSGNLTLTLLLPTNGYFGRDLVIKKINAANTLTIDAATAGSTIDGAGTKTLTTQWSSLTIRGFSTGWRIIASYL